MVEVSVIIVTWNAEKFITKCLDSVFSQSDNNFEIIVVDNGSKDKTKLLLKEYSSRMLLIENEVNMGFCYANNQALKITKGRYILTLNSDVILDKNYSFNLKEFLAVHNDVGMVQGKFLKMDGKTIDSLGLYLSRARRFFDIANNRLDSDDYNQPREIFGPCAAAAMYKKELLENIKTRDGYFDNRFFFLVEDFDIAWRARKKGWKAMFTPNAICYHYRDSSRHPSLFKQYLAFRNRYFMILKNEEWKTGIRFLPFLFIYDLPRLLFLLFTNPYISKAIIEIFVLLPCLIKERNKN